MSNDEVEALVKRYFSKEGYTFPDNFEHRVDPDSSAVIYSFIRDFKPKTCLQIGCWEGGTTCIIMAALLKNELPFRFEASELLADKAYNTIRHVMEKCGKTPGMMSDITCNLKHVPEEIDFLFHDTDHDLETTKWVVDNIFPRLKDGALVILHDWAVQDIKGKWVAKTGAWPETEYLIELHDKGQLPLEKVYWNYGNPNIWELGVFKYRP